MSESSNAVFLSYASQDAEAARRICETLRAAGIVVWFDQSELRGGDAWDQHIRTQVQDCALFIPIISANTASRPEGYFRLEWDLADHRTHMVARNKAFVVPVCIDRTPDSGADVPESFHRVQWTRLPGGETPASFCDRIAVLLGGAVTPALPHLTEKSTQPVVPQRASLRWMILAAVGVAVASVIGWQAWRVMVASPSAKAAAPSITEAAVVTSAPQKSIAVLPFVDMSEKRDQEYFSDGLTEELLDLLSQVPDLRVPARTSSFYFKGKSEDIASIAQKLHVAHILEGSVRKAGNTIRVTAQLIRADNGYHLWSKAYDRDFKDIFKVQDEIAAAVVEALKAKLLPAQELSNRHRTNNTEAYTQYLLGNQFRVIDSPSSNRLALAAYKKAVEIDASYAAAYSGLSEAEWRIADQSTAESAGYQRAAAAAEKAISLAPDSPEGYSARGLLENFHSFDWHGAQADYDKALTLDPNYTRALIAKGSLLATLGQLPAGIETMRKAIALDPLSVGAWRVLVAQLTDANQLPAAQKAINRLSEINPQEDPAGLAGVDLLMGRTREALAAFKKGRSDYRYLGIAMAEHTLGHAAESQRALDVLEQRYANVWAYQIAEVHAWRGENDKTFEWLDRAYRQRDGGLPYLTHDVLLKSVRGDPRYKALLHRLNLPET